MATEGFDHCSAAPLRNPYVPRGVVRSLKMLRPFNVPGKSAAEIASNLTKKGDGRKGDKQMQGVS